MGTLKDEKGVLEFENTLRHRRRWDDLSGKILGRLRSGGAVVNQRHQRPGHAGRVGVLDDVAAVHDARCALGDELLGALEDLSVGGLAAAANEHRNAAGDLHHAVVHRHVIGGVGLDDVGPELHALAHDDLYKLQRATISGRLLASVPDDCIGGCSHDSVWLHLVPEKATC